MPAVEANGITIEYEEQGTGDPLLLLIGLGGQLVDWPQDLVDMLSGAGFRVIRMDNRDNGLSTEFSDVAPPTRGQLAKAFVKPTSIPASYRLSDMANDAVGLLDALGIESAHVTGMSMGGMIAQQIAIDHPGRVRSLVSIMSTTGNRKVGQASPKIARKALRKPAADLETSLDQAVEFFRAISGSRFDEEEFRLMGKISYQRSWRPDGTARQLAAIIASGDRTEALRQLEVPTLVVHGMEDTLVRPSGGIATAKAIAGSRLLMFNDMGHNFPDTRRAEIAAAIRRNADRVQESTTV